MGLGTNLKKFNNKAKSIKMKSMIAFTALSISFLVIIWLFQAIFFTTIYEGIKSRETKNILNTIKKSYSTNEDYKNELQDISVQQNASIIIFSVENENINLIYNTSRKTTEQEVISYINSVILYMGKNTETNFISDNRHDFKTLTCSSTETTGSVTIYYCVSSPIVPLENVRDSFNYLLIFISIGVVCLTLIGAYILSAEISKPITKMATQAKEINNSNKLIPFEESNYTEINELSDTLNYAISELQKTDKIRKEVIANVSHELKTPLTMIKSYTELIKDISGDNKEKRQQHLDVIYKEATRLEYLLNDMMDYSKLESGIITYNKVWFNLSESLHKFYTIYSEQHPNFKIFITCPKKVLIFADKQRIEQVITNLLNNAINYSKSTLEITINLKKIPNEKFYKLEIIDKGVGISEENLEHIFDRHFRSASAKRTTIGSGIGLSIVKSILNDHNYQFGVISKENEGSNFYIIFPTSDTEDIKK